MLRQLLSTTIYIYVGYRYRDMGGVLNYRSLRQTCINPVGPSGYTSNNNVLKTQSQRKYSFSQCNILKSLFINQIFIIVEHTEKILFILLLMFAYMPPCGRPGAVGPQLSRPISITKIKRCSYFYIH